MGIVASRLSEKYSCPTFMICLQDGKGKGSCRSFGGFNLFAALEQCRDLLEGFGGHELAAGFTILEGNIPAFRARMLELVRSSTGGAAMESSLEVDAEADPALLTQEGVLSLDLLEPYGTGNPKPVFSMSGCTVTSATEVGGGRHLKLKVSKGGRSFDAIFFSVSLAEAGLAPGDRVTWPSPPRSTSSGAGVRCSSSSSTCAPPSHGLRRSGRSTKSSTPARPSPPRRPPPSPPAGRSSRRCGGT